MKHVNLLNGKKLLGLSVAKGKIKNAFYDIL